jgi:hypothetical protein
MRHEDLMEKLRKNALPIHPKCLGLEFTADDEKRRVGKQCNRIVPEELPVELLDEPTGEGDPEGAKEVTVDETCRCDAYINPSVWWNRGGCPLASHWKEINETQQEKVRMGQQKQKKKK